MITGECGECGSRKNRFIKTSEGSGIGAVSGIIDAGANAVGAIADGAVSFGNAIDQGRRTTQEIRENTGKNDYIRAKNANRAGAESLMGFNEYFHKLQHYRAHKPSMVPANLRLQSFDKNQLNFELPHNRRNKRRADEALEAYAKQKWYEAYGYYP